ncbi:hypothetical protein Hanom_Chr11g01049031 [Helianthus anomalus]
MSSNSWWSSSSEEEEEMFYANVVLRATQILMEEEAEEEDATSESVITRRIRINKDRQGLSLINFIILIPYFLVFIYFLRQERTRNW